MTFSICRSLLAFVFIPVLQKELDNFKDVIWNTHRIPLQKDVLLPNGIPNHMYDFPDEYNMVDCSKYSKILPLLIW